MSDRSAIEWCDASWNPIRARLPNEDWERDLIGWHCLKISPGCQNCYAERLNKRIGTREPYRPGRSQPFLSETILTEPLRWRKPRKVFVASMTDLFGEWVPDEWIDRVFAVMALCDGAHTATEARSQRRKDRLTAPHVFQVLTKRASRMREYISDPKTPFRIAARVCKMVVGFTPAEGGRDWSAWESWPLPQVWLGISAEDQQRLDERVPELLATPAAVRWVSAEPLLGPLDFDGGAYDGPGYLRGWHAEPEHGRHDPETGGCLDCPQPFQVENEKTDWVVVGGESGPGARPMHPEWARSIRDHCQAAGVPYFFKQWGAWMPTFCGIDPAGNDPRCHVREGRTFEDGQHMLRVGKKAAGRELDGRTWDEFPMVKP